MKKILKLFCCIIILLLNSNVFAKRMYFITECESSIQAALNFGINLSGNGWYDVGDAEDDEEPGEDLDGGISGGGGRNICNAPSSEVLACDFGCVDAALSGSEIAAHNANILSDLNAGEPIAGNNYCKMICIPRNEFDYPGFIPNVEQGTKFTWTIGGASGILDTSLNQKILKLDVTSECAVVFDLQSWKSAYEAAQRTVDTYNNLINTYGMEYPVESVLTGNNCTCPSGYYMDGSYCIPYHPPIIPIRATCTNSYESVCDSNYDKVGNTCYLKRSVYDAAVSAAATINNLKNKAIACSEYNGTPNVRACGTAYLTYSDEKYGGDGHRILLNENSGGVTKISGWDGRSESLTIRTYNCASFGSSCSSTSESKSINYYKKAKFSSKADWTLPEYFYRYVLNNGVSIFNYNESNEFNNASGSNSYYGRYQNYIDMGFPNFPVNFNSSVGNHEISIDFTFCSGAGVYAGNTTSASCPYEVYTCEDGACPPGDGDDNGSTGIDVIYRVIDLKNPFPGLDGDTRVPGRNWSIVNSYVDRYITHNRGVEADEVYAKEPMYTIELTPSLIQDIRNYNKDNDINDFRLVCTDGEGCRSIYLKELFDNGELTGCGTENSFDACARVDGR